MVHVYSMYVLHAGSRMQDAGSREGCMATSQTMMDDGMRDERCAWKGEGREGGREGLFMRTPSGDGLSCWVATRRKNTPLIICSSH